MNILIIYIALILVFLIFMIASLNTKLPASLESEGIMKICYRMSAFFIRFFEKRFKSIKGYRVKKDLKILNFKNDMTEYEDEYYIKKLGLSLLVIMVALTFSMLSYISVRMETTVKEGGYIERNSYGEGEKELNLTATFEGGGNERFDIILDEQKYTKKELDNMIPEFEKKLLISILGDNVTPDHIDSSLNLIKKLEGYPFEVEWDITDYKIINSDGSLVYEEIPDEGCTASVTAIITYNENRYENTYIFILYPRILTQSDKRVQDISEEIEKANTELETEKEIQLPQSYGNLKIHWATTVKDSSFMLFCLGVIASILVYISKDNELHQKILDREKELMADYPKFVSQLVLYMGAGMTVRNVFVKLSREYAKEIKKGASKRYLYEEISKSCNQLESGASESEVYEQLGIRCALQPYTRLCTLLNQNLKKGNSELLSILQEESEKAFRERMDRARKLGEEAGTKLLMPMVMMLLVIMVIIMIPAYLSF